MSSYSRHLYLFTSIPPILTQVYDEVEEMLREDDERKLFKIDKIRLEENRVERLEARDKSKSPDSMASPGCASPVHRVRVEGERFHPRRRRMCPIFA